MSRILIFKGRGLSGVSFRMEVPPDPWSLKASAFTWNTFIFLISSCCGWQNLFPVDLVGHSRPWCLHGFCSGASLHSEHHGGTGRPSPSSHLQIIPFPWILGCDSFCRVQIRGWSRLRINSFSLYICFIIFQPEEMFTDSTCVWLIETFYSASHSVTVRVRAADLRPDRFSISRQVFSSCELNRSGPSGVRAPSGEESLWRQNTEHSLYSEARSQSCRAL